MTFAASDRPLHDVYDMAMLDLDGVVYVGDDAVDGAAKALAAAKAAGMTLAYITNNASRPAQVVASHLRDLGMPELRDADVVTSAQAVAGLVAEALPPGATVLVVGGEGLQVALEHCGLVCVSSLDDQPAAVVQGFHPDVGWSALAEASYAIAAGLPWFVSNTDLTVPTARGVAPGNGSLVQAVRNATRATPVVAGKPERALLDETIARLGASRPLMVGDRLDTDIDGAINAGVDSLAVLTGVCTAQDVADAEQHHRPSFVGPDLCGLLVAHPPVQLFEREARCAGVAARLEGEQVVVDGDATSVPALRAAISLAWSVRDASGLRVRLDGMMDR